MYGYVNLNKYTTKFIKYIVFFLLGDSPVSEFYVPTFRNTLFHFHNSREQEEFSLFTRPVKMKQTKCSERRNIKLRRRGITQKKEYNIHNKAKVY